MSSLIIGISRLQLIIVELEEFQELPRLHQTYDFWQMHSLPRESRNYIPYYLAAAIIAKDPEEYGFTVPKVKPFSFEEVVLEHSADLAVLARVAGIKVKTCENTIQN